MPAPAVIPAPIAYINAAAVKKLVVGSRVGQCKVAPFACVAPVTIAVADQPLAPNGERSNRPKRFPASRTLHGVRKRLRINHMHTGRRPMLL